MTGVVYLNQELQELKPGTLVLGENDFAKIDVGTVQFYVSQTVAPPVLRKNATHVFSDPFLTRTFFISLILTVATFFALEHAPPQTAEVVQVPETIATILYHPEKYAVKNFQKPVPKDKSEAKKEAPVTPPKPQASKADFTKPLDSKKQVAQLKSPQPGKKQSAQSKAKEGEGAKAKGAEGSRGARNAKSQGKPQTAATRPSTTAGQDRGGTPSQIQDNGNVQMLKGETNKILDLLGGSGEKIGKSGSKLKGFGGFSTQGNGGAGLEGSGQGGGGTADTLLGGQGEKGRGGGKVGTGLGAEGTGSGIVGGKTRIELRSGGGDETVIVGSIDRDAIDAAIRAHRDEFLYCYEREVNAGHPGLSGKVISAFVIGGSGRASQFSVASSSMNYPAVDQCVLKVISRIQFPQPAGGMPVTVTYPFNFSAQK